MATKSKFRKLSLGPSEPITRRNSVQGMFVVADYTDPLTAQRTLMLEKIAGFEPAAEPKPKPTRKRRAKANAHAEPATAFPGQVAANG